LRTTFRFGAARLLLATFFFAAVFFFAFPCFTAAFFVLAFFDFFFLSAIFVLPLQGLYSITVWVEPQRATGNCKNLAALL
jgi:hypothetical protein